MANQEHLEILTQYYWSTAPWNTWRKQHPDVQPDLSEANLYRANLNGADLSKANLYRVNLSEANLIDTNLSESNLYRANLYRADLSRADLSRADLSGARLFRAYLSPTRLSRANLSRADLSEADLRFADLSGATLSNAFLSEANLNGANLNNAILSGANLIGANLVETNLTEAILTECRVYGISAWDIKLTGAQQNNLIITPVNEPEITVDNLKIAQFIYLLLDNQEIRDAIDTIAKKAVLILGRFTPERKAVLDAIREALREIGYLPIVFDFEKPASRDITETISTLAHLARFVIADITDARSIPQELKAIVPNLPSVPVQPLILNSQHEYGMFEHFTRFPWVLPVYRYIDEVNLLQSLQEKVITPAEQKAKELEKR